MYNSGRGGEESSKSVFDWVENVICRNLVPILLGTLGYLGHN
jgi:hypothetical protein